MPVYLSFRLDNVGAALGLDPRQGQAFTQDRSEFVEGELDFQEVLAGGIACPLAELAISGPTDRLANFSRSLAHSTRTLATVTKLRDLNLRHRDRDKLASRLSDHLAMGNVFAQVSLDLAAHDLLETIRIPLDFPDHGTRSSPLEVLGQTHPRDRQLALGRGNLCTRLGRFDPLGWERSVSALHIYMRCVRVGRRQASRQWSSRRHRNNFA